MNVSRRSVLRRIAGAAMGAVSLGMAGLLITDTAEGQTGHARRRRHRRRRRRRIYVLSANHTTKVVEGKTYYVDDGVTYEAVTEQGELVYVEVFEDE